MTPKELAEKYMDCIFKTGNLEELKYILSEDLQFSGPLFNFNSAEAYIEALRNDPPIDFKFELIKSFADDSSACFIYRFSKPGVSTSMTQLFETVNEKIISILLIFDSATFPSK